MLYTVWTPTTFAQLATTAQIAPNGVELAPAPTERKDTQLTRPWQLQPIDQLCDTRVMVLRHSSPLAHERSSLRVDVDTRPNNHGITKLPQHDAAVHTAGGIRDSFPHWPSTASSADGHT